MYHGVSATTLTSITPALFAQQMSTLHRAGVRVLPLRDIVDLLPPRPAAASPRPRHHLR
jgi:hypothetical protein